MQPRDLVLAQGRLLIYCEVCHKYASFRQISSCKKLVILMKQGLTGAIIEEMCHEDCGCNGSKS